MIYLPYTKRAMAQTIALEGIISCSVFHFHELKHTFSVLALQNGVDVKILSAMLGHYSAGFTLDTYAHVITSMQKQAASAVGNFLSSALR
jgi:integrase